MRDLENSHAESQVAAFLRRCVVANGSVFILAVPWPMERFAKALLTNLQVREGVLHVDTVVLSELNWLSATATSGRQTHCRS